MKYRYLILLIVLGGLFAGCAPMRHAPDPDMQKAQSMEQDKRFREAVELYEKIAVESPGTARGADALFSAGRVRCQHDNPQKEYQRALQNFDEFLRTYPDNSLAGDAQDWRSLIKTILDLKKENERLSKNIEELKRVDIRHEERRRR